MLPTAGIPRSSGSSSPTKKANSTHEFILPIKTAEICYSSARKGKPLTGLNFYDSFGRIMLKLGRDGY